MRILSVSHVNDPICSPSLRLCLSVSLSLCVCENRRGEAKEVWDSVEIRSRGHNPKT